MKISAALVIYNEGKILRGYFDHLKDYIDDFVVADQQSTDNSIEICKAYGARVFKTKHWGYSEPDKEFIAKQAKHDWVIVLDPDERFDQRFLKSLPEILQLADNQRCVGIELPVYFILDGYQMELLNGRKQIRIVKKGTKCSTRIHSNYGAIPSLLVNVPQYHFKTSEEHFREEKDRINLNIHNRIKSRTIVQNIKLKKELEDKKRKTIEFNKNFKSDIYKFPKHILIESSVNCNANCAMCPNDELKRKNKEMPHSLFKKIIDQCVGKDVEEIHPFMHGEPFMVKDIFEKMKYINDKLPTTKIIIFTNGALLDEEKSKKLLKIKNVKEITFSLDAYTEKTYKKIRKGLDFDKTKANIFNFIKLNNESPTRIPTSVSMTRSIQNQHEVIPFGKFWISKVDKIDVHRCTGRNKEVPLFGDDLIKEHFKEMPCNSVFNVMPINTDGEVVMCCEDAMAKVVIGNVNEQSMVEIWNNDKYNTIRTAHIEHRKRDLPICKDCNASM